MSQRPAPHRGIDTDHGDRSEPSKTELKVHAHALQKLGVQLAELSEERLAQAPLPDNLREAIEIWRTTRSHEGRRRQMQYIGKLMRNADELPLREFVAGSQIGAASDALALHQTESWRAQLIADDEAVERWAAAHPQSDPRQLRSLVDAARRDAAGQDPAQRQPKSHRELFKFLRPSLEK